MAKKDIEVDTSEISRIEQSAFDEFDSTLRAQYRSMYLAIEALNDTWQGTNHDAFVADYMRRRDGIDAFHDMLSAYLRSLGDVFYRYNEGEKSVADYVK